MKRNVLFGIVISLFIVSTATIAFANTVTVNLQGIDALGLEIGGFQIMLDESVNWPPSSIDGQGPPTNFGNDFFINSVRTLSSNTLGLGGDQPYSGDYWYVDTLIDDDDTDGADYVRGVFGFDDYWEPDWNKLNDGLLLIMSSSLNLAVDTDNPGTFFYDYNDEIIDGLILTTSWVDGDQVVDVSAVPIPSTLLLLGGGLVGLVGLKRRNRA